MAKVGRPLKFETVEIMQDLLNAYFDNVPDNEWTITGLALALDTSRETLMDYEEKDEFSDTVRAAKSRVESYTVQRLFMNNPTGSIFNLKNNFNWKDKQEIEHSGDMSNNGGVCRASEILGEFRGSGQGDPP